MDVYYEMYLHELCQERLLQGRRRGGRGLQRRGQHEGALAGDGPDGPAGAAAAVARGLLHLVVDGEGVGGVAATVYLGRGDTRVSMCVCVCARVHASQSLHVSADTPREAHERPRALERRLQEGRPVPGAAPGAGRGEAQHAGAGCVCVWNGTCGGWVKPKKREKDDSVCACVCV